MTQYTHRMTLVVPELLIPQANQLALIAGESLDDVNTFTQADWQDEEGNLYSVCSTVIKPIVLSLLGAPLTEAVLTSEIADMQLAQAAMNAITMYVEGVILTLENIIVGVDIEPFDLFNKLGLTPVQDTIEELPVL